jgi:hypothetical protein
MSARSERAIVATSLIRQCIQLSKSGSSHSSAIAADPQMTTSHHKIRRLTVRSGLQSAKRACPGRAQPEET